MNATTGKKLNLHLEKSDIMLSAKVPTRMKILVKEMAIKLNMSESAYVKLAINDRLEMDMKE